MKLLDRLRRLLPGSEWSVERGEGWASFTRTKPHVTVLTNTRSCHMHYWTDDPTLDKQGWGMADLVCHGCNAALRVLYPESQVPKAGANVPPLGIPTFRNIRESFEHDHRNHVALGNEFLCPPQYAITETRDLRSTEGVTR